MEKYFRTEQGQLVNIIEHTLEQLEKWPTLKIYIGSDSDDNRKRRKTSYATCIVYRYGNRGGHFIYFKEEVPIIKDMFKRLFNEAERTIATAALMKEHLPAVAIEALEFDYNNIKKFNSNVVISAVKGWVRSLNYKAIFKNTGEEMIVACKAADRIARR